MAKFATVDINGVATGFYDDTISLPGKIPEGAIPITVAQWEDWFANLLTRRWQNGALVTVAPPLPTPDQLLEQKLAAGITITSTATPALNGVYAIDSDAQRLISGTAAGIAARNRLPGGGSTFGYGDIAGAPHNFTAADFLNFADAVEDYVYTLYATARTLAVGGTAAWPAATVTIA